MTWLFWAWSNIAFVGALAGLVALWWFWPRFARVGVPVAFLIASSAFAGGLGWGEKRYVDGRDAGAAVEAAKWQKSYDALKSKMESERKAATAKIEEIRIEFVKVQSEKEAAKQDAATSNARVLAIINNQPIKSRTITCEKANEKIIVQGCPSPYSLRLDPRIVRNLQRSRNQNGTGKGPN